jgi:hypothetical protein
MRRVADVRTEEPVQRCRKLSENERGDPAGDRGDDDRSRPEQEPDVVRDRQQQPEEDRQPAATKVVLDREMDGMLVDEPFMTDASAVTKRPYAARQAALLDGPGCSE